MQLTRYDSKVLEDKTTLILFEDLSWNDLSINEQKITPYMNQVIYSIYK